VIDLLLTGKSDPYCEVSLGSEVRQTRVINGTLNPKWNDSMQFSVKDLSEDILSFTVYDKDYFSPDRKSTFHELPNWNFVLSNLVEPSLIPFPVCVNF